MKQTGYDMLYLTVCAVNQIKPDSDKISGMNLEKLYQMSQFHSLTAIVCTALESAGIYDKKFIESKAKAIRKNILLDSECVKICEFLEKNRIWHMLLKGAVIKEFYPENSIRQMSDNDILYDKSGQKQVLKYMEECGYTAESVGKIHHDTYIKPPVYNFEMHTVLFEKDFNKDFHIYYSEIKNRLLKDSGKNYTYHFKDEDFYVYMTAHEYKHYSRTGTGLRSLLDCFLYVEKKGKSLNWDYIAQQTEILGISDFEYESRKLSEKIFSCPELPELTEAETKMLEYYIFSGTYGTIENVVNRRMKMFSEKTGSNSKFRYLWSRIFPPMEFYKQRYPFSYQHKILIPISWTLRLIKSIMYGRKSLKTELNIVYRSKDREK